MKSVNILNHKNLKRTSCREGIIDVIMVSDYALSENEIRERLKGYYDRTTFYRSFKTLEDYKVLHKIVIDNQTVKYALDNSVTQKKEHAHFYCNDCQKVQCLEIPLPENLDLPKGYEKKETEIIIKGTCPNCKKLKSNGC